MIAKDVKQLEQAACNERRLVASLVDGLCAAGGRHHRAHTALRRLTEDEAYRRQPGEAARQRAVVLPTWGELPAGRTLPRPGRDPRLYHAQCAAGEIPSHPSSF